MCTSIVLKSKDENVLLARTMDFSFELEPEMRVFPRHYPLKFDVATSLDKHYAFMGLSKDIGNIYIADGVNEHGLSCAALYFEGYAKYSDNYDSNRINVAPHEVVMWMLATCKHIDDVVDTFQKIEIVNHKMDFLGVVPPLHWVFLDESGSSLIFEIVESGLNIHDNNLGILTNSPDYVWHMTNVRSYIGLDPQQVEARTIYGEEFKPFGQGSGTFGLPGDFTPPSRFIKTLYNKLSASKASNSKDLVLNASHILNGVDIPKGSVKTPRATLDYTQYTSYMLNNELKYYYRMHDSLNTLEVNLKDYDLDISELIKI